MRKFFLSVLALAAACGAAQAQKVPTVAVVNLPGVIREYNKAMDQFALLRADAEEVRKWSQNEELALGELRKAAEAARAQASNGLLNEQGRAAAKAEFEARAKEFQARQEKYAQDLRVREETMNTRQQQLNNNAIDEIRPVVAAIATEKGIDLVLNSMQAIFAAKSLDVTDEVVKRLNTAYGPRVRPDPVPAAPAAATPAAGAPAPAAPAAAPAPTPAPTPATR